MHTPFDAVVLGAGPGEGDSGAPSRPRRLVDRARREDCVSARKVCGEYLSATNLPLLRELGLSEPFLEVAGPDVRRVAIFAGSETVVSDMPRLGGDIHGWGHAPAASTSTRCSSNAPQRWALVSFTVYRDGDPEFAVEPMSA